MHKEPKEPKQPKEPKEPKDIKTKCIDTLPYSEKGIAFC
tara:strand:+ start:117 stop:233 length:117 start_codon:yes stop_codon:yes gene_type:complete